ncbi:P-loop containing nucleoside triphosphate hydrolase protein [Hyaloraphidium curvatum]|nr:P-loop containing nucleoside triphosphate hydrolase protein [Hyaloraphidium curvatum]
MENENPGTSPDPPTVLVGEVRVVASSDAFFTMKSATLGAGDTLLLRDAAMVLQRGHRYGIVGENGCGKSTLMRAVRDAIMEAGGVRAVYVGQNDAEREGDSDLVAVDYVVAGDSVLADAHARMAELEAGEGPDDVEALAAEMDALMNELEAHDAEGAKGRAEALLKRLGFPATIRAAKLGTLSGGWRTRLQLARALFARPDLLMLDEPTNHADLVSVLQLASILRDGGMVDPQTPPPPGEPPMTVMVVSHDAAFLDMVCTDIISIHKMTLQCVPGNYANFEQKADEYKAFHEKLYEKRQQEDARMKASVQQQKAAAGRAGNDKALKQAASRERKAETRSGFYREDGKRYKLYAMKKLGIEFVRAPARAEPVMIGKMLTMKLPETELASGKRNIPLVELDGVSLGYPGRPGPVLVGVTASVHIGDRIALVGKNGTGKSTLLRAIADQSSVTVLAGTIKRAGKLAIIDQNQLATLEGCLHESGVAYLRRRHPQAFKDDEPARAHMARFGLGGSGTALLPIEALSGGLRVRLILADVFAAVPLPDLLVLDEITNHLDFESITALANALKSYAGAVLFASHNAAFILDLGTSLWITRPEDPGKPLTQPKRLEVHLCQNDKHAFTSAFRAFAKEMVPAHHRGVLDDLLTIRATRYTNVTQQVATVTSLYAS